MRVVDQPLPANGGPGLFEVGAHDDEQVFVEFGGQFCKPPGIVSRGIDIVDRAGPHNDQQSMVGARVVAVGRYEVSYI